MKSLIQKTHKENCKENCKALNNPVLNCLSSGITVLVLAVILFFSSAYTAYKDYQLAKQVDAQQRYIETRIVNNLLQLSTCFDNAGDACVVFLNNTDVQLSLLKSPNMEYVRIYDLAKRYFVLSTVKNQETMEQFLSAAKANGEIPVDVNDISSLRDILKRDYYKSIHSIAK